VDGHPAALRRTPDGLTAVAVPGGDSRVELRFQPPLGLTALFWLSTLSGVGYVAFCFHRPGSRPA
jgi:hypothetical protein